MRSGAPEPPTGSPPAETDDGSVGDSLAVDRRSFLATVGAAAGLTSLAGCAAFERESDAATTEMEAGAAQDLAERFAPTLYFDEHEQWFPTDPRSYETETEDETVVDGFDALNGYTEAANETGEPPAPSVFYHAVEYEDSSLAVVQYWYYSVFDQFTTNFHWHDWEVFHVFVDTEDSATPQLYVASSHSGAVPNNEYLDPSGEHLPRILSELGSHSSALSVNDVADRFQRLPIGASIADITNQAIESLEDIATIPLAYGLPRDEGTRLPYVVPELDESPLYEHERLPAVSREDLVAEELTIRSFADLSSPPDGLVDRSTGRKFRFEGREPAEDVAYELAPTSELEHITDFTGPQLSFEFAVPSIVEDAISSHITTTGVPWKQARYDDPAADITDSNHRAALAERYDAIGEPAPINTVVASVTDAISNDDAPENEGLQTEDSGVESVALLESDPEAVPTFKGLAVLQDVPDGDHQLTVNAPGTEPHSETVTVAADSSGLTTAGVKGEIPLVAREKALKLEVDADQSGDEITAIALEDDFAGRLYDAPFEGTDAVYIHRGGAYTTEVRDRDDEVGAYRVNPADETSMRLEAPQTGKESLAEYVATVAEETAAAVRALEKEDEETDSDSPTQGQENAVLGLAMALDAVAEAARQAAQRAADGKTGKADQSLTTVMDRLERVQERLTDAADGMPEALQRAVGHRLDQTDRRSEQALAASKL